MQREAIVSSNVESIGYDAANQVVEVEFKGGRLYHYVGVDQVAWDAREEHPSMGKWVAQILKPSFECFPGAYEPEDEPEEDVEAEYAAIREEERDALDAMEETDG